MKTLEEIPYKNISDKDAIDIIEIVKEGVAYSSFEKIYNELPFTLDQWARFLDTTPRTFQRWKRVDAALPVMCIERIIEVYQLYKFGVEVFGVEGFNKWLNSNIQALDNKSPVSFLNNSYGIQLIRNKLGRIQHGILA
jgi:putative toxin-antitoxin system antitoxin component (TIGR02293 family)